MRCEFIMMTSVLGSRPTADTNQECEAAEVYTAAVVLTELMRRHRVHAAQLDSQCVFLCAALELRLRESVDDGCGVRLQSLKREHRTRWRLRRWGCGRREPCEAVQVEPTVPSVGPEKG